MMKNIKNKQSNSNVKHRIKHLFSKLLQLFIFPVTLFSILSTSAFAALDPAGCTWLSVADLREYGFEPVRAHMANQSADRWDCPNLNGLSEAQLAACDDTAAIQSAIDAANTSRRVVYFNPGKYLVSDTLTVKMDWENNRNNNSETRFGQILHGSYCGSSKPTIRLKPGVATTLADPFEPKPVISLWRLNATQKELTTPDQTHHGKDWNQVVRNLKIEVGNNPGAVGIRHGGAEGSSIQEVDIDVGTGYAGLYYLNSSGGYTYNVNITGGKHGIYVPGLKSISNVKVSPSIGGGSTLVTGLTLKDQVDTPIVFNHFGPLVIVGFDIEHENGLVISTNDSANNEKLKHQLSKPAGSHISLIDGKIKANTNTANPEIMLHNQDSSVYFKNVYFTGAADILYNGTDPSKNLTSTTPSNWTHVEEYAYSEVKYGETGNDVHAKYIEGIASTNNVYSAAVNNNAIPENDLLSRHAYQPGLCNIEGANVDIVTIPSGADHRDTIQQAINNAGNTKKVFLPSLGLNPNSLNGQELNTYSLTSPITLKEGTVLCGTSRYSTVLETDFGTLTSDKPVISTASNASQSTLADLGMLLPKATKDGTFTNDVPNYLPQVYAIYWQSGGGSIFRDISYRQEYGDPGDIKAIRIANNGGGKWYGMVLAGGYRPDAVNGQPDKSCTESEYPDTCINTFRKNQSYIVYDNNPLQERFGLSTKFRHLQISNDSNGDGIAPEVSFYPFHCQHRTIPQGSMCELNNAANVSIYGIKAESSTVPERSMAIVDDNAASDVHSLIFIKNSTNVSIVGYEGLAIQGAGRGLFEVTNSTNVTIANAGRRFSTKDTAFNNHYDYNIIRDNTLNTNIDAKEKGFLSLYKSESTTTSITLPQPTAYWPLENTTAADDITGNHNGVLINSPSSTQGILGNALWFNGNNTANKYAQIPASANLQKKEFTISSWFKINASNTGYGVIVRQRINASPWLAWELILINGKLSFRIKDSNNSLPIHELKSNNTLAVSQWHHAVGIVDVSGNMSLYINNDLQDDSASNVDVTSTTSSTLRIGASGVTYNGFKGPIDEVCYFGDNALSLEQVELLYNDGNGTVCTQ